MKKMLAGITAFLVFSVLAWNLSVAGPYEGDDIEAFPSCSYCGMDRKMFAHSRVLIEYEDGAAAGMCSIHCAAIDIALTIDKPIRRILTGDYNTQKLTDAEAAAWVIGGEKSGVMTRRAKWAFENKPDADGFILEHGGAKAGFDDVLKASFEDMYDDVNMIRTKRQKQANRGM